MGRPAIVLVLAGVAGACAESNSSVTTGPSPSKCQVVLSGTSSLESGGGVGSVTVTTQPECVWNASTPSSWISGLSPSSGQGSGRLEFRAAVNPSPTTREGEVVVNDDRLRVVQQAGPVSCSYTLTPATQTVANTSGTGSITVTTTSGCSWSATSSATWLTLTGSTTGTTSGTVTFSTAANTGGERSATVSLGGQQATVRQLGVSGTCDYAISSTSQSFPAAGGSGGPITVTTSAGCTWTARTTDSWITVLGGATGTGNGAVTFTVAANTGPARAGSITIAGLTLSVTQTASVPTSCTYSIAPTVLSIAAVGGTAAPIAVTASAGCAWAATSGAPWLTIVSGESGNGNGTVSISVAANTATTARTGTLTVAGQTFTVNQEAAPVPPPCSISISPAGQSVGSAAGTGTTITVTAGPACAWTATSNTSWLTLLTGASGTGNGTVTYRFDANDAGLTRTGSLSIGGQTFTVDQAAAPCTFNLSPLRLTAPVGGQTGASFEVQTLAGCAWSATSTAPWITIAAGGTGTGRGFVSFNVSGNTGAARSASITVQGQAPVTSLTFTVDQAVASCALNLSPNGSGQPAAGTTNALVDVTANLGTCTWTATSNAPWLTIATGASGTGSGQVRYNVAQNTGLARTGTLTIAGQTFTVSQTNCAYAITPTSQNHPLAGATMRFVTVTNAAGCTWPWTATSNVPWLTIDPPGSGTGAGFITYTVGATAAPRSGTISVAGQTFTASQP